MSSASAAATSSRDDFFRLAGDAFGPGQGFANFANVEPELILRRLLLIEIERFADRFGIEDLGEQQLLERGHVGERNIGFDDSGGIIVSHYQVS